MLQIRSAWPATLQSAAWRSIAIATAAAPGGRDGALHLDGLFNRRSRLSDPGGAPASNIGPADSDQTLKASGQAWASLAGSTLSRGWSCHGCAESLITDS